MNRSRNRLLTRFVLTLLVIGLSFTTLFAASAIAQNDDGQEYIVKRGDSLFQISRNILGDGTEWRSIVEATNARAAEDDSFRVIDNPRLILVGQKLWIPGESMGLSDGTEDSAQERAEDTVAATEEQATPEPEPEPEVEAEAAPDDDAAAPEGEEAVDAATEENGAPIEDEDLQNAAAQLQVALEHAALLQSSLEADDLDGALTHAEHIVNVLDGEAGRAFGDVNRDGVVQNPGDGVGVRVYVAASLAEAGPQVRGAIGKAEQLFAVDTVAEALPIAAELTTLLEQLQRTTMDAQSGIESAPAADAEDGTGEMEADQPAMLFADVGSLTAAQAQLDIAFTHFSFFMDEVAGDDVAAGAAHVEHVINILQGEEGLLYGDNNRDGQTQNPGDGVGVRGHLEATLAQVEAAGEAGADADLVDEASTLISAALEQIGSASEAGFALFAIDDAAEAMSAGEAMGTALEATQAAVTAVIALASDSAPAETTSAPAVEEAVAPDLEASASTLADALAQMQLAANHFGFMQGELENGNVAGAHSHAEHVINILDGEDGLVLGDHNRDGQTQNPGDGIGVRGHLVAAGRHLGPMEASAEGTDQLSELRATVAQADALVLSVLTGATDLFTSSTAADVQSVATALEPELTALEQALISAVQEVDAIE